MGQEAAFPGNFNKFAEAFFEKGKREIFRALLKSFLLLLFSCVLPVKLYLMRTSPRKTGQFLLFWKDVVLNDSE